jgi:hypothetical protein
VGSSSEPSGSNLWDIAKATRWSNHHVWDMYWGQQIDVFLDKHRYLKIEKEFLTPSGFNDFRARCKSTQSKDWTSLNQAQCSGSPRPPTQAPTPGTQAVPQDQRLGEAQVFHTPGLIALVLDATSGLVAQWWDRMR